MLIPMYNIVCNQIFGQKNLQPKMALRVDVYRVKPPLDGGFKTTQFSETTS